jgi:hypothetical protein
MVPSPQTTAWHSLGSTKLSQLNPGSTARVRVPVVALFEDRAVLEEGVASGVDLDVVDQAVTADDRVANRRFGTAADGRLLDGAGSAAAVAALRIAVVALLDERTVLEEGIAGRIDRDVIDDTIAASRDVTGRWSAVADIAIFESTGGAAAIACVGVPVVACLAFVELAVAARGDAHGRSPGAGELLLDLAGRVAAVAIGRVSVVAGLALGVDINERADKAVSATEGGAGRKEERVFGHELAIEPFLDSAIGAASVAIGRVSVVASTAVIGVAGIVEQVGELGADGLAVSAYVVDARCVILGRGDRGHV